MKPDWKDAPEWANWLAMDADGEWLWYEIEPVRRLSVWDAYDGKYKYGGSSKAWEDTREKRP